MSLIIVVYVLSKIKIIQSHYKLVLSLFFYAIISICINTQKSYDHVPQMF